MRKIRYGMVGGGAGGFIGAVHRMAAALDSELELVAGVFGSTPERSKAFGTTLDLDPSRVYGDVEEMMAAEAALPADERMELVSIVTPNHTHFAIAKAALEAGFHVACDKPMTNTVEEAEELCRLTGETGLIFLVTHNYTGYPMVKEARERLASGEFGPIRKVIVEYSQGWLSTLLEAEGHKQATWRADPEKAGVSSALGDIGSHAHNLAEFVTGHRVAQLYGDLGTVVPGRRLEDDATVLLRFEGKIRGILIASQISYGERNHLRIRVYCEKGGIDWCQEEPNRLRLTHQDGTETILNRGGEHSERARAFTRLPGGHPEGFIEAFANLYRSVARTIRARTGDADPDPFADDFPTVADGARGVHFIHTAVESSRRGEWMDARYEPPRGADGE